MSLNYEYIANDPCTRLKADQRSTITPFSRFSFASCFFHPNARFASQIQRRNFQIDALSSDPVRGEKSKKRDFSRAILDRARAVSRSGPSDRREFRRGAFLGALAVRLTDCARSFCGP